MQKPNYPRKKKEPCLLIMDTILPVRPRFAFLHESEKQNTKAQENERRLMSYRTTAGIYNLTNPFCTRTLKGLSFHFKNTCEDKRTAN